jgi:hypothetical protein
MKAVPQTDHTERATESPENDFVSLPFIFPLSIFLFGTGLLFWNLDARYLWQDEAATAVLAERLLSYGRPLGYDGKNLITIDRFRPEEEPLLSTANADDAIRFFVDRGDFKKDTTWIDQPWGQFVAAGLSLALLGENTFAARLPFALAGALLATLLFMMVRDRFSSTLLAMISVSLLLGNTFWLLHIRQCRYYALSSLFLLFTLEMYLRWRERRSGGITGFIVAAWFWFQQDFGTVWAVFGVLVLDAIITGGRQRFKETVGVFAGLSLSLVPFVLYYELIGRLRESEFPWSANMWSMLFQLNQFQLPFAIALFSAVMLFLNRNNPRTIRRRRFVLLALLIATVLTVWMPTVGPFPFYRYVVPVTGLSVIVVVYGIGSLVDLLPRFQNSWVLPVSSLVLATLFLITNFASWPGNLIIPKQHQLTRYLPAGVRPELQLYLDDLRKAGDDPNRGAVEFLRQHLTPDDEVICNYEDIPLMFYLPNSIRGGIGAFRVADRRNAPRFAVMRRSVSFYHEPIFLSELNRHRWRPHPLEVPDIPWGNIPDPRFHHQFLSANARPLIIYERIPRANQNDPAN